MIHREERYERELGMLLLCVLRVAVNMVFPFPADAEKVRNWKTLLKKGFQTFPKLFVAPSLREGMSG